MRSGNNKENTRRNFLVERAKSSPGKALIWVSIVLAAPAVVTFVAPYFTSLSISWQGMLAIVSGVVAILGFSIMGPRHQAGAESTGAGNAAPSEQESEPAVPTEGYPEELQSAARRVKAVLQMAIGLYALGWLAWAFYRSGHSQNCVTPAEGTYDAPRRQLCYPIPAAQVIFKAMADALGAATAVQLAFTLFTPGPDEALDPVLLALAAALLLQLGSVSTFKWEEGIAVVLYSLGLGVIFVIRIFLAPDENHRPPWWWKAR
jgi:hypothetical protein